MKQETGVKLLGLLYFGAALLFAVLSMNLYFAARIARELGTGMADELPPGFLQRSTRLVETLIERGAVHLVLLAFLVSVIAFTIVAVGLVRLRAWARKPAMVLAGVLAAFQIYWTSLTNPWQTSPFWFSLAVACWLVVCGWIVWYLRRSQVKQAMGAPP